MSYANAQGFNAPPPPPSLHEQPASLPKPLRVPAIVLFVVGLLILGGGIAKFVPGGIGTGAALCFAGLLIFGLSFVPLPRKASETGPMSLTDRLIGIFFEPGKVFKDLGAHPRWVAAFLIIAFLNIG